MARPKRRAGVDVPETPVAPPPPIVPVKHLTLETACTPTMLHGVVCVPRVRLTGKCDLCLSEKSSVEHVAVLAPGWYVTVCEYCCPIHNDGIMRASVGRFDDFDLRAAALVKLWSLRPQLESVIQELSPIQALIANSLKR